MLRYITVVYTINDSDAFEPTRKAIFDQFKDSDGLPFAATAVSNDHEIQRVYWMEQAVENIHDSYDLKKTIDAIVGHTNIGDVKSLNELRVL